VFREFASLPLYEYQCTACGRFEIIQKFSDALLTACPTCGREVQKLISAAAFQFKGTGWYVTDYARKSAPGDGPGKEGSGKEGSGREGSGKEGSGKEGSGKEGSGKEGSGKEGSGKKASSTSSSDSSTPHNTTSKDSSATGSSPTK
jgi:putative FmdB family regulatory protein